MNSLVGPWIRRFLVEYVLGERNYSLNTQQSYRDSFLLFLPFAAKRCRCGVDRLALTQIKPKLVREFIGHLEKVRHCGPSTVNQRLAALRAWVHFVATNNPELLEWSIQIQTVHFKKHAPAPVTYLEKQEVKALLSVPDRTTVQGLRDYAILMFLYNTGARVSEACRLTVQDLDLAIPVVTLHGKGRKIRRCPLWRVTAVVLRELVKDNPANQAVFLSQRGEPLTRYGIHTMIERLTQKATEKEPSLSSKRVSPHSIRHATAMHLLHSGVDINTIRVWLGHVSLQTTNIYVECDLKMKAEALARCEAPLLQTNKKRRKQNGLMHFLKTV